MILTLHLDWLILSFSSTVRSAHIWLYNLGLVGTDFTKTAYCISSVIITLIHSFIETFTKTWLVRHICLFLSCTIYGSDSTGEVEGAWFNEFESWWSSPNFPRSSLSLRPSDVIRVTMDQGYQVLRWISRKFYPAAFRVHFSASAAAGSVTLSQRKPQ